MQLDKAFLHFVNHCHFNPVADTVEDDTQADNPSNRLCAHIRVHEAVHAEACRQYTKAAYNPPATESDTLEVKRTDSEVDAFKHEPESEDERQRYHQWRRMEDHNRTEDDLQQSRKEHQSAHGDKPARSRPGCHLRATTEEEHHAKYPSQA